MCKAIHIRDIEVTPQNETEVLRGVQWWSTPCADQIVDKAFLSEQYFQFCLPLMLAA